MYLKCATGYTSRPDNPRKLVYFVGIPSRHWLLEPICRTYDFLYISFILFFIFNVGDENIVLTQVVANILVVNDNNFHKLDGLMWQDLDGKNVRYESIIEWKKVISVTASTDTFHFIV